MLVFDASYIRDLTVFTPPCPNFYDGLYQVNDWLENNDIIFYIPATILLNNRKINERNFIKRNYALAFRK